MVVPPWWLGGRYTLVAHSIKLIRRDPSKGYQVAAPWHRVIKPYIAGRTLRPHRIDAPSVNWIFEAQKQPFWRYDMKTDLVYWFVGPLLYGYVMFVACQYALDFAHLDRVVSAATTPLSKAPLLMQMAIILLLTDLLQYWAHRLFHQHPLWRFHSIHHAPVQSTMLSPAQSFIVGTTPMRIRAATRISRRTFRSSIWHLVRSTCPRVSCRAYLALAMITCPRICWGNYAIRSNAHRWVIDLK